MTTVTITDNSVASKSLTLSWPESVSATFYSYRIYWRPAGGSATSWNLIAEIYQSDTTSRVVYAYTNAAQDFSLVEVSQEPSGALTEETYTAVAVTPAAAGTPQDSAYRLIHPTNPAKSIDLGIVIGDDFEIEAERTRVNLIGRGRKANVGSVWGYAGSLDIQLRDSPTLGTAKAQRAKLEAAFREGVPLFLRNPFGDLVLVEIETIEFERVAAGPIHDAVDCSLELFEVVP